MRIILLLSALAAILHPSTADAAEWPAAVPGFVAPAAGEHPRLLLRKADVAAYRKRAATPEGQLLIARTKKLLGIEGNPATRYSLWNGAAAGFLYQATGDKKYADLAREYVQKAFDGEFDHDRRYSWRRTSEPMRAGPTLAAIVLAYDLAYDGWEPAFRQKVVDEIFQWNELATKRGGRCSLERLAMSPDNPNAISNHFALQVGGAGLAVLALWGDPEVNAERQKLLAKYQEGVFKHARKVMTDDFGQSGYFHEHPGPGVIAMTWTFQPWLAAERIAAGRDWAGATNTNSRWMTLKFVHQTVSNGQAPFYINPAWASGTKGEGYGNDVVESGGGHHAAIFAQGFGAVPAKYHGAMLWTYEKFILPTEAKRYADQIAPGEKAYDALNYPHRPLLVLASWPFDVKPQNPAEVLPRMSQDKTMGQYVHRNQWQDNDDIIVSVLYAARTRFGTEGTANRIMVRAYGARLSLGTLRGQDKAATDFVAAEDGSGVSWGVGSSVAVDFSGSSGAPGLMIIAGKAADGSIRGDKTDKAKLTALKLGDVSVNVVTFSAAAHPTPKVEGDRIVIGGQSVRWEKDRLVLEKIGPAPKLKM